MKRKLFTFVFCLVMLLATLFTSCNQEVSFPEMVTISYVSEFGTLDTTEKVVVKGYKLTAEDLPPLTQYGYTFDKWYINKEEATVDTVINKNTILVAKWDKVPLPETVTISYVSEFGTLVRTEKIVEKGYVLKAEDLPLLTQDGYSFNKWYINDTEVKANTVINKDTVLVAKWDKVPLPEKVIISFVSEFGTLETTEKIVEKGYKLKADDLPKLTAEGYTFDKWYINKEEATVDTVINKNTVLVAKWKQIPLPEYVTLSYVSQYGTLTNNEKVVVKGYTLTADDLPKLAQEGYTFDKWYINNVEAKVDTPINKDSVLVAKWDRIPLPEMVTISYISEYGTLAKTEKIVEKGYKLKADDLPTLKEEGYTFGKWYINKEEAKADTVINKDTVLVAKWIKVLDKTAPKNVTFGEIKAANGKAVINWTIPTDMDTDLKGFELSMSPACGTLANPVILGSTVKSFSVDGLTNGTNYTFTIKSFDTSNNISNGVSKDAKPLQTEGDKTAPKDTILTVKSANDGIVVLNWTQPSDNDLKGYKLSSSPNEGTLVNAVTLDKDVLSFTVSGLKNATEYNFTLQSFDNSLNYSVGANATATPSDTSDKTAPGEATFREITANDGKALVTWINPKDIDLKGVELSVTPAEGTLINPVTLNKTVTSFSVDGLTNGTPYTFTLKSFDTSMNFSTGVSIEATPSDTSDKTAPKDVTFGEITAADGKAVINWTIPENMDSDLKGFELSMNPPCGILATPVILGSTVKSFSVDGLKNGTPYTFTIKSFDTSNNISNGVSKDATPSDTTDKTAPAEVTNQSATNLDGTVALKWTDPSDTDLFGIEITYTPKSTILNRSIEKMVEGSIFVAPNTQYVEIPKLTNDTEYTFTLKAMDLSGNKSEGVTVTCTPKIIEGKPLSITLTPSNSEKTNKDISVSIKVDNTRKVKTVKYAEGTHDVSYFENNGNIVQDNSFTIRRNGTYSVFVQDVDGKREVQTIDITNIDLVKPNPITNFKAEYHANEKKIVLTWVNPTDEDFKEVKIIEGDNTYTFTNKEVSHEIPFTLTGTGTFFRFKAYTYDNVGNIGDEVICDISIVEENTKTSVITGFIIPNALKIMKGKTIYAEVKGNNLKIAGVLPEHYKLTGDSSIVTGATIELIDNNNVKVGLKVPEVVGSYTVNIAIGDSNINGTFTVEESAVIGDILLNDGTYVPYVSVTEEQKAKAVAVAFGANSQGKLLGLGLKESEQLSWAPKGTTGHTTQFTDIICTPSAKGTGAADKQDLTFTGDTDGSDNWDEICKVDTEGTKNAASNYPAFNWVNNYATTYSLPEGYKDGWYMPCIAELTEIYRNKTEINAALNKLGKGIASPLIDYGNYSKYWSSSQSSGNNWENSACGINFEGGFLWYWEKTGNYSVCCVRAF